MASNLPSATTVLLPSAARLGGRKRRGGERGRGTTGEEREAATGGGWDRAVGTHPRRECARDLGRRRETRSPGTPRRTPSATCTPRPSRADGTRAAGGGEGRGRGRDRETQKHPPALVAARRRRRTSLSRMRALREERRGALSVASRVASRARLPLARAREGTEARREAPPPRDTTADSRGETR